MVSSFLVSTAIRELTQDQKAARAASNVRKTLIGAFDEIETMFSEIELMLLLYPGDENIEKASVGLIVSSLVAAENVMEFFLKGTCAFSRLRLAAQVTCPHLTDSFRAVRRFVGATMKSESYERETIASMEDIKSKCEMLFREAGKSYKYQSLCATQNIRESESCVHRD